MGAAEFFADAAGKCWVRRGTGFASWLFDSNPGSPRQGSADPGLTHQPLQGWCAAERSGGRWWQSDKAAEQDAALEPEMLESRAETGVHAECCGLEVRAPGPIGLRQSIPR